MPSLHRRGRGAGGGLGARRRDAAPGLAIAGLVVVLDQLTKWAILTWLERAIALTPFFNLVVVWNRGVSFGMFDSAGRLGPWVLPGLALAVVVLLLGWLRRVDHLITAAGLGLIIGGAIGNVIDRVRFGAVIDFLDFPCAGLALAGVQRRRQRDLYRRCTLAGRRLADAASPQYITGLLRLR